MPAERVRLGAGAAGAEAARRARDVLAAGGIALLPAEGVYGYHARVDREDALVRLQTLKPREAGRGYILLIADPADLSTWARGPLARAADLARAHWPGALTLVLPAAPAVPAGLGAADGTVALRCPGSAFLRDVIRASATALVSTSANAPGEPAPSRAPAEAPPGVDLIVDGGPLSGAPSTVVRVTDEGPVVLRPGAVRIDPGSP